MSQGKHSPTRLHRYQETHSTIIQQFIRSGFVVSDELMFEAFGDAIFLEGTLRCLGSLYLDVQKRLTILEGSGADMVVQTAAYSYNAALAGVGNIFRYDSPHSDHNTEHHVHRFDVLRGDKMGNVMFIYEEENIPTLGEVITELRDWYYTHLDELPAP